MLIVGSTVIAYGAWVWFEPAGYLTAGVLLVAGGLARARAKLLKAAPGSEPI